MPCPCVWATEPRQCCSRGPAQGPLWAGPPLLPAPTAALRAAAACAAGNGAEAELWQGAAAASGSSVDVSLMSADELAEHEERKLKLRKASWPALRPVVGLLLPPRRALQPSLCVGRSLRCIGRALDAAVTVGTTGVDAFLCRAAAPTCSSPRHSLQAMGENLHDDVPGDVLLVLACSTHLLLTFLSLQAMGENLHDDVAGEAEDSRQRRLKMIAAVEGDDWSEVISQQTAEAGGAAQQAQQGEAGGAGGAPVTPFARASVHRAVGNAAGGGEVRASRVARPPWILPALACCRPRSAALPAAQVATLPPRAAAGSHRIAALPLSRAASH